MRSLAVQKLFRATALCSITCLLISFPAGLPRPAGAFNHKEKESADTLKITALKPHTLSERFTQIPQPDRVFQHDTR